MKFYLPAVLNKWDSIKANDGYYAAIKMNGQSIGYLCAYSTYEDCKAEFPDRNVIEMETVE